MLTKKRALNRTLKRRAIPQGHPPRDETGDERVSIEYCVPGNHERIARTLARAIEREFGFAPKLLPSRGGVFEVTVGGRLIFSKRATRRFPDEDEVFYHVKGLVEEIGSDGR